MSTNRSTTPIRALRAATGAAALAAVALAAPAAVPVQTAQADPGTNIVAAEVHTPGVAELLQGIHARGLTNVRILEGDGRELLTDRVASGALAGIRVYFPDPWPKAKHHKRRLIDPRFAALAA